MGPRSGEVHAERKMTNFRSTSVIFRPKKGFAPLVGKRLGRTWPLEPNCDVEASSNLRGQRPRARVLASPAASHARHVLAHHPCSAQRALHDLQLPSAAAVARRAVSAITAIRGYIFAAVRSCPLSLARQASNIISDSSAPRAALHQASPRRSPLTLLAGPFAGVEQWSGSRRAKIR